MGQTSNLVSLHFDKKMGEKVFCYNNQNMLTLVLFFKKFIQHNYISFLLSFFIQPKKWRENSAFLSAFCFLISLNPNNLKTYSFSVHFLFSSTSFYPTSFFPISFHNQTKAEQLPKFPRRLYVRNRSMLGNKSFLKVCFSKLGIAKFNAS